MISHRHRIRAFAAQACAGLLLLVGTAAATVPSIAAPASELEGTYAIEGAQDLQARGLYHFLYVHPGGKFLMAAEWAGNESSRAAGTWSVQADELTLMGNAHVSTNQGAWDIPYRRTFRIERRDGQTWLTPVPEKNRFGMLGWPNAYVFVAAKPVPPFPNHAVPEDESSLLALMERMSQPKVEAVKVR